jgi:hypothetical protein
MSSGPPSESDGSGLPPFRAAPSMRFLASPRHQHPGSAAATSANPPPPSALRFSQPLGGLLPVTPCGFVSPRWHAQAFPFRAFPSQGAVPSLDGRCPLVVAQLARSREGPRSATRLQGLAPLENPLSVQRRLGRLGCAALLGFHLSRVLPLPTADRASAIFPSRASTAPVRDGRSFAPQGLRASGARLVSRETADPPEVPCLFEPLHRASRDRTGLIVSPRGRASRRRAARAPSWVRAVRLYRSRGVDRFGHRPVLSGFSIRQLLTRRYTYTLQRTNPSVRRPFTISSPHRSNS